MRLFAGSYTKWITPDFGGHGEGIYSLDFDPKTGCIKIVDTFDVMNPSYLAVFDNVLYTFNEVSLDENPMLYAFKINKNGCLQQINRFPLNGSYPCHIMHSQEHRSLFVSCYGSGDVLIHSINNDGSIGKETHKIQHSGKSKNLLRQEAPHVHFVGLSRNGKEMYVADLGIDKIMVYTLKADFTLRGVSYKSSIQMPEGSGPRHFVIHPNDRFLIVLTEMTAEVFLIDLQLEKILDYIVLLPDKNYVLPSASAIKISGDGRFVYVSERSNNKVFILKFDVSKGILELIGEVDAHVLTPRDFMLDTAGNWLIMAGQVSDSLSFFKRNIRSGEIEFYSNHKNFKSISCLI